MATVIQPTGRDREVLLNTREALGQQFVAPDWLDLRVGFVLSITKFDNENDTNNAAIAEQIGTDPGNLHWNDRYAIGLTDSQHGQIFLGYTNRGMRAASELTEGSSKLVSSDDALGDDSNYWRPANGQDVRRAVQIWDQNVVLANSTDGCQIHFPRNPAGTGPYATLLMLRLQRDDVRGNAKRITMTAKQGTHNGDVGYTNNPIWDYLYDNLQAFPTTVQTFGPVTLSEVPDVFYVYWPFHRSRIRIHEMGFLRAR